MKKLCMKASLGGMIFGLALVPQGAAAQDVWTPGSELVGHAARVETIGVVNTVYFDPNGVARIVSPGGQVVDGRWFAQNQTLCLQTGPAARECWPYRAPFQAQQPILLTSDCAVTSNWMALSTTPPPPPPVQERAGERG